MPYLVENDRLTKPRTLVRFTSDELTRTNRRGVLLATFLHRSLELQMDFNILLLYDYFDLVIDNPEERKFLEKILPDFQLKLDLLQ